jgi:hypothetical protein
MKYGVLGTGMVGQALAAPEAACFSAFAKENLEA